MKKKIILFLSFLMVVMCLTGCSGEYVIQGEQLKEITQIANNVVNQKGYELPEGYEVSFPDSTTNAKITIRANTKILKKYVNVTFDISTEEIKVIEISYSSTWGETIRAFGIFLMFICMVLDVVISIIKKREKRELEDI